MLRVPPRLGASAVALLATALIAGCGGDDDEDAPARATGTATPTPAATNPPHGPDKETGPKPPHVPKPPPAPRAEDVTFPAADGEPVTAQFIAAGRKAPAIVLLHEIRGGPDQWEELVAYLHAAGFATLAYQSRPGALEKERLPDALGAVRWLRDRDDVDPQRLALVGASIGASTTVLAAATGARAADASVALSPPDSGDIWALQDDGEYRPHDVLFIADAREAYSAESMLDGAVRSEFLESEGPGHGVQLLKEPGVRDAVLAWLEERVR